MKKRTATFVSFVGTIENEINKRNSIKLTELIKRDLSRYYELLALSMPDLNENELNIIKKALINRPSDLSTARLLYAYVNDYISINNIQSYQYLTEKCKNYDVLQNLAILDYLEQNSFD